MAYIAESIHTEDMEQIGIAANAVALMTINWDKVNSRNCARIAENIAREQNRIHSEE